MGRYPGRCRVDRVDTTSYWKPTSIFACDGVTCIARVKQYGKSLCIRAEVKPQGAAVRRPRWAILQSPYILPSDARRRERPPNTTPNCSTLFWLSRMLVNCSVDIVPPPFRYENLKNHTNERSSLHLTVILRK